LVRFLYFGARMIPMVWARCVGITETLYPDSDEESGNWIPSAGGTLASNLDEDDSDYILLNAALLSSTECPDQDEDLCELGVTNPTGTPGTNACQRLIVRYRSRFSGSDSGCVDIQVKLLDGVTVIASNSYEPTASFVTRSFTLSAAQYNSITDHNDLRIEITGFIGVDSVVSPDVQLDVAFARLEYLAI
jgi:hypothetical protein